MQQNTRVLLLDEGWQFCLGDVKRWNRVDHDVCYNTTKAGQEVGDMQVFLEDNVWMPVAIPHDWNTRQASDPSESPDNGFKPRGIGWYYNEIDLPDYGKDAYVLLEFEGIMGESVVYVNGVLAARNESGYTAFAVDVSDYMLPGQQNRIVVSVDNTRWEGWWYEGAGIYRPVRLFIKPAIHLSYLKTFVRPMLENGAWRIRVSTEIENSSAQAVTAELQICILNREGACIARLRAEVSVPPFECASCAAWTELSNPELWSPDHPYLYDLENQLFVEGVCLESEKIPFGVRDIQWTDHGMFINDQLTPVRGICCHQDHAGVGIAVTQSLMRYRIARLKAMGCNAYRCAHHAPSRYLLEVCDELGMLVMVENRHYRTSEEVMRQLDALVLLSRNHPSVFLYSLFNEEPWQA